jgi:Fe-S cluster assembly protein SufD
MIKLFEENNENIVNVGTKYEPIFNIASDKDIDLYVSWGKVNLNKVTLNISGAGKVSLLEVCDASSAKVEIKLLNNARLSHSIAFFGGNNDIEYDIDLKEGAEYDGALADFTSGNNKFNFVCRLNGDYSKAIWNLASLASNRDEKDFYVSFYHYGLHTFAQMQNYGVCENEASLSFLGTSSIEKGSHGSQTHQSAKIMVFDPKCKAVASPTLCIDDNDVQASHAAVVGQINEDHIYYFMTRGIEEESAKKLITLGYLNPILRFFDDEDTLNKIKENIERRF